MATKSTRRRDICHVSLKALAALGLAFVALAAVTPSAGAACASMDARFDVALGWEAGPAVGVDILSASPDAIVVTVAPSFTLSDICVATEDGENVESHFTIDPALPVVGPAEIVVASTGVPGSRISVLALAAEPTTPPAVLPVPWAQPIVAAPPAPCARLRLVGKQVLAGRSSSVTVRVLGSGGKPIAGARVVVRGAGVEASRRTNGSGYTRVSFIPRRTGVLTVQVAGSSACIVRLRVAAAPRPALTG